METDTVGPAVEFNWGALPNVHLHIIVPAAAIFPSNNPSLAPAGQGPRAFGLGDIELGIKYRFVQETKHRPMIGTFTMFEIPTGSAPRGLGVGRTWYKVPLWAQKSFGPWTTYGGGGVTLVKAPGYRNYPFAGWLVQRDLGKKVTLGTEVFYHGPEGLATAQTRPATLVDVGGYYKFRDPGFQLLFCYGHTAVGQKENYAYLGLYWTWGKTSRTATSLTIRQATRSTAWQCTRTKGNTLNISSSDVILLAHAAFGVTGCMAALWVFVEALNARPANAGRIQTAALADGGLHGRRMDLRRILVRSLLSSRKRH